jgi:hypothetical protein
MIAVSPGYDEITIGLRVSVPCHPCNHIVSVYVPPRRKTVSPPLIVVFEAMYEIVSHAFAISVPGFELLPEGLT